MIAESPTSPRHRDRITINPIGTDTIARLYDEAERTGRSIAELAADWMITYQPPARRVVAVVWAVDEEGERRWRSTIDERSFWRSAYCALSDAECEFIGPDGNTIARIHDAGPGRYELTQETP